MAAVAWAIVMLILCSGEGLFYPILCILVIGAYYYIGFSMEEWEEKWKNRKSKKEDKQEEQK